MVRVWFNLPEWVKRSHGVGAVWRRAGCLVQLITGALLDSPWHTQFVPHGPIVSLKRKLPPLFHDGAYSAGPGAA